MGLVAGLYGCVEVLAQHSGAGLDDKVRIGPRAAGVDSGVIYDGLLARAARADLGLSGIRDRVGGNVQVCLAETTSGLSRTPGRLSGGRLGARDSVRRRCQCALVVRAIVSARAEDEK